MGKLQKTKINDTEVWIETDEQVAEKVTDRVSRDAIAKQTLSVADNIQSSITAYCGTLIDSFNALNEKQKPTRVSAEFGLKFSGDLKVYFVNAAGEAALKIKAEWET